MDYSDRPCVDQSSRPINTVNQAPIVTKKGGDGEVTSILIERGKRYGKFTGHAAITQAAIIQSIKNILHAEPKWNSLADDQKESLDMITHKIGRIMNGDPDYGDSWVDIAGYAQLVADRLAGVKR